MDWTIVGIIAGLMTSFSFIPQIMKGFKTKSLEGLSYPMLVFLGSGILPVTAENKLFQLPKKLLIF